MSLGAIDARLLGDENYLKLPSSKTGAFSCVAGRQQGFQDIPCTTSFVAWHIDHVDQQIINKSIIHHQHHHQHHHHHHHHHHHDHVFLLYHRHLMLNYTLPETNISRL